MSPEGGSHRAPWRIAIVLLLAAPLLSTCWVHGDGIGYVAMLRSAVVDRDLALADEFAHLAASMRADAAGLPARLMRRVAPEPGIDPLYHAPRPDAVTGRVPAHYSVGPPLAWAPAYLIAHAWTRATAPRAADGYGGAYYLAIALSSLAFGIAGAWLAHALARAAAGERAAFWAVLAIVWATPFAFYLYLSPDYSHALTTLSAGAFALHAWRTRGSARGTDWFVRGLLAGLLFLVRWNDVVLALPVVVAESATLLRSRAGRAALPALLAAAAAGTLLAAAPQLATWQYFHGRPWVRYPEVYAGLPVHGLLATLVSTRHGLFLWTPLAVPAVAGLVLLLRRERALAGVALASLALLVVANCTARDWWGGASFGMRRLVSGTPYFALGLAALFEDAAGAMAKWSRAAARALAPAVCLLFSLWNLLLIGQYASGMISHTGAVPFSTLAGNQARVVGHVFARLWGRAP